jgi:3-oxoadipate enol-lactonase
MVNAGSFVSFSRFVGALFVLATALSASAQTTGPRTGFLDVPGGKLFYEECGAGPRNLVLVHDGVVDSAVWNGVWPSFCNKFHTVRYDRRGFGKSPAATDAYYETDDLKALLAALKIERTVLLGSSHGGELAINFTLDYPSAVEQLVLVGAVVSGLPFTKHFLNRGNHAFELLGKGQTKEAITEWSGDRYLVAPGNDAARTRLLQLLTANPQDMSHQDFTLAEKPALGRLHEIHVPTLILVGERDIPDVHAHAGAIEAGIPNVRRIVVEGTGHLMYLEKPSVFTDLVFEFVGATERSLSSSSNARP